MNKLNKHSNVPTPHIEAQLGAIAKRVIMPGDPKRAKWIAQTFLKDPKLVTDVRGISGLTGTYKGVPITVMGHGMGIPSISIYSHELYNFYGVKVIYRVGSCGVSKKSGCQLGDVVIVKSGWSDIPTERWLGVKCDEKNVMYPTKSSLNLLVKTSKELGYKCQVLPVACNTYFYSTMPYALKRKLTKTEIDEMESFALFAEAKLAKAKSACLLTVSDNVETKEAMDALSRQTTFKAMIKIALEAIIKEKI